MVKPVTLKKPTIKSAKKPTVVRAPASRLERVEAAVDDLAKVQTATLTALNGLSNLVDDRLDKSGVLTEDLYASQHAEDSIMDVGVDDVDQASGESIYGPSMVQAPMLPGLSKFEVTVMRTRQVTVTIEDYATFTLQARNGDVATKTALASVELNHDAVKWLASESIDSLVGPNDGQLSKEFVAIDARFGTVGR